MRQAIAVVIIYPLKVRLIALKAARCLRPCDRLMAPLSVMLRHLRVRRNEMSNSFCGNLPAKVKTNSVKSCRLPETL